MSGNIPLLIAGGFEAGGGWQGGTGFGQTYVGNASSASSAFKSGEPLNWAVVYDRKNPDSKPLFSGASTDSTSLPAGLDQYLTDDYILCWVSAAFVTAMPQGALYQMLDQNGGGPLLRQMEVYATAMACGLSCGVMYMMASVPGTGLRGVERLGFNGTSSTVADTPVLSFGGPPVNLLCELVPAPNGDYTPLELA